LPAQRWANVFASVAIDLLLIVTRPLREVDALAHKIGKLLCHV
jgi:hypothetical protein